jgi:beta-lactam-binding protein with PASTA domain
MPDQPSETPSARSQWVGWGITVFLLFVFAGIAFVGLRSTERITLPNTIGMTQTAAVVRLTKLGLAPKVQPAENPGDAQPDTIVAQDPEPGVGLRPGATVTLEVAPPER